MHVRRDARGIPVLDVPEVVQLEQSIDAAGTSLATLMDCAGEAVANRVLELGPSPEVPVVVLAGAGNNGGDGWVAARLLAAQGQAVCVLTVKEPSEITAQPARDAAAHAVAKGVAYTLVDDGFAWSEGDLRSVQIVVDALLGTGFSGSEVRGPAAVLIAYANGARAQGARVLAVDAPSGLSVQTGAAATPCVRAHETLTMMVLKPGLVAKGASAFCGDLSVAEIADVSGFLGDVL